MSLLINLVLFKIREDAIIWTHNVFSWKYLIIWKLVLPVFSQRTGYLILDLHPELLSDCAEKATTVASDLIRPQENKCLVLNSPAVSTMISLWDNRNKTSNNRTSKFFLLIVSLILAKLNGKEADESA